MDLNIGRILRIFQVEPMESHEPINRELSQASSKTDARDISNVRIIYLSIIIPIYFKKSLHLKDKLYLLRKRRCFVLRTCDESSGHGEW